MAAVVKGVQNLLLSLTITSFPIPICVCGAVFPFFKMILRSLLVHVLIGSFPVSMYLLVFT